MSDSSRTPADMLLLAERRGRMARKLGETHAVASGAQPPGRSASIERLAAAAAMAEALESVVNADDVVVDESAEDVLIAETGEAAPAAGLGLTLYRPLVHVSLAALHWSAAVDHEALQTAIVCCPVGAGGASAFEMSLIAVLPLTLAAKPEGVPTLHVTLSAEDIAAVEAGVRRTARPAGLRLVRAAALPTTIAGAESVSGALAAAALSAYRNAALVHAWNAAFGAPGAADLERDRDAAAVNLLSTLRGLLGET